MMGHLLRFSSIVLLFVIKIANSNAEIIDGPANLRDSPRGQVIASLLDKSRVEIEGREGDWYRVRVLFYMQITPGQDFPAYIEKGVEFLTDGGTNQGKALTLVRVEDGPWSDEKRYHLTFTAWTHKQNIIKESLAEEYLVILVKSGNLNIQSKDWQHYLDINEFAGGFLDKPPFESYMLYENDYYDVSPGPRLLLFTVNNKLFAVLHDKNIELGKDTLKESIANRYPVTILDKSNPGLIKHFRDSYYPVLRIAD